MPVAVSAELTNHCNLHCPECAVGSGIMKRERGFMDIALFSKVMAELKPYLYYVCLYFQGEPMLHRDFFAFTAAAGNMRTIVSTNGHFLSDGNAERIAVSGLWKLVISVDGTDDEVYSNYRKGGDLEKVLKGLREVSEARKRSKSPMKIEIQFLVNRFNEHQIADIKRIAVENGASLRLKSMQVIDPDSAGSWLPSRPEYRRYHMENGTWSIKNPLPDRCRRLWFNPVITWDGKVLPCCFDKDAQYVMGDLNRDSFRNIWRGEEYFAFRRRILTGRDKIDICRNCTSGMKSVNY
jgi:radical SAM protein with 4Fe4S-binding SPASM domain